LETNKQKERRIKHILELLRNLLERCGYKKINKPKDNLFWSRIGSEIRGGGLQQNILGGGKGGGGWLCRGRELPG